MVIRTILVPVDFSPPARAAFRRAVDLASHLGSELVLLHAFEPLTSSIFPLPSLEEQIRLHHDQIMAEAVRQLEEMRDREGQDWGEKRIHCQVVDGHPAEVICQCASSLDAQLIVIGTHGRSGLAHLLLGSVAEKVIRHAPCDVLAVRG